MNQPRLWQLQRFVLLLWIALFTVFTYTFLHEGGHAAVGLLSGGTLTGFSVNFLDLSAHVAMTGSLTPAQTIANNLAGACLPLFVWLIFMIAVPKRANYALEIIKIVSSLMFLSTLLAWVFVPVLVWQGRMVNGDDVANFLNHSGVHPLWVIGAALLAFGAGWRLFAAKIDGLRREIDLFRTANEDIWTPAVSKTTYSLIGIFFLCGLVAFSANGFRLAAPDRDPFQPPAGYRLVKTIDLSQGEWTQAVIYAFTLDNAGSAGIYLLVENVNSDLFEVRLTGPDSYNRLIVHAEGYTARQDNPHLEEILPPGQYQCLLTSQSSSGGPVVICQRDPIAGHANLLNRGQAHRQAA